MQYDNHELNLIYYDAQQEMIIRISYVIYFLLRFVVKKLYTFGLFRYKRRNVILARVECGNTLVNLIELPSPFSILALMFDDGETWFIQSTN